MKQFAEWLSTTSLSVWIQNHNAWAIPAIQTVHILGIAAVFGAVFMLTLRILGWAGRDQTLRQTVNRFGPWLTGSLCLLAVTGVLMVIGEPARELLTFSFWAKMVLIAIGTVIAVLFRTALRKHEQQWETAMHQSAAMKGFAVFTFLLWTCIIVLGRLIAYDHLWGSWSPGAA